jgi:hypothetical protein
MSIEKFGTGKASRPTYGSLASYLVSWLLLLHGAFWLKRINLFFFSPNKLQFCSKTSWNGGSTTTPETHTTRQNFYAKGLCFCGWDFDAYRDNGSLCL